MEFYRPEQTPWTNLSIPPIKHLISMFFSLLSPSSLPLFAATHLQGYRVDVDNSTLGK